MARLLRNALMTTLSPAGRRARLMILTFHQVSAAPDPLAPDVPDAESFRQRMTWLGEYCNVLPLPEAGRRLAQGELPARAACITFDDGYANNRDIAAPILLDLGLPATFFIAGGAVDDGIMWNDLVIEGVRQSDAELDLSALGLGRFSFGRSAERVAAIAAIIGSLKYKQLEERAELAEAVFRQASGGQVAPRLMMTREQVAELARQGFDLGAHTVNHPILKELTDSDADTEIAGSKTWVQNVTGKAPVSFAYPNGRPGVDYTEAHARMVADAGFELAVSTAWGCAVRTSSRFELPRFSPWESDRQGFWLRLVKTLVRSYL